MDRRGFLKWLGVGTAAVVVAPEAIIKAATSTACRPPWTTAYIAEYSDYANFSDFAIASADPLVASAANELGVRAGQSIRALYFQMYDYQNL